MNYSIHSFGKIITTILVVIFFVFIYLLNDLYNVSKELKYIEKNRHLMILKADELRQSSDDLTKFARHYAVTSDMQYRDNYYHALDIRNGKVPKPINYDKIYWDLLEPLRSHRHPDSDSDSISLDSEIKKLPYSPSQYNLLSTALNNSDDLVYLELKAFAAMNEKKQKKAIKILYSKKYLIAKEKIMLPIDDFLTSLQKETNENIKVYNEKIDSLFQQVFYLVVFGLFVFVFSLITLRKKILIPIHNLTRSILSFKTGGESLPEKIYNDDEIGLMTRQFYSMKAKLDEKYEALKQLSLTDPLTGIKNRRSFFDIGEKCLLLSLRKKKSLSLMILDIDYFKKVNDTYGHTIGDNILKHLTKTVKLGLRESDTFARYGGEEFVILLPDTDIEGSLIVGEKIRSLVQDTPYVNSEVSINITVSIGVRQYNDEKLLRELITKADEALYRAKENGRNRIEC